MPTNGDKHCAKSFRQLLAVLAFTIGVSHAQTGAIEGFLLDSANAAVPDVKVAAFDQDNGVIVRETRTGRDGLFSLRALLPVRYSITIQTTGFKTLERADLVLHQNQVMALGTLSLQVGAT